MGWPDTGAELLEFLERAIPTTRLNPAKFKIMTAEEYVRVYDWLVQEQGRIFVEVDSRKQALYISLTNLIMECCVVDEFIVNPATGSPTPFEISIERLEQQMFAQEGPAIQKKERGKVKSVNGMLGAPFITVYSVKGSGEIRCQLRKEESVHDSKQFLSVFLTIELLLQRIEEVHGKNQPFKVHAIHIKNMTTACRFPFPLDAGALKYICSRHVKDPPVDVLQQTAEPTAAAAVAVNRFDPRGTAPHAVYYEFTGLELMNTMMREAQFLDETLDEGASRIPMSFCPDLAANQAVRKLLSFATRRRFSDSAFEPDKQPMPTDDEKCPVSNSLFIVQHKKPVVNCLSSKSWQHVSYGYARLFNDIMLSSYAKDLLVGALEFLRGTVLEYTETQDQWTFEELPNVILQNFDTQLVPRWNEQLGTHIDGVSDEIKNRVHSLLMRTLHSTIRGCCSHPKSAHYTPQRVLEAVRIATEEEASQKCRGPKRARDGARKAAKAGSKKRHRNAAPSDSGFAALPTHATTGIPVENHPPCIVKLLLMELPDPEPADAGFKYLVHKNSDSIWQYVKLANM